MSFSRYIPRNNISVSICVRVYPKYSNILKPTVKRFKFSIQNDNEKLVISKPNNILVILHFIIY